VPLVIEGPRVCLHFTSNPYTSYWGWRVIISPLAISPEPFPALFDLEALSAELLSRVFFLFFAS
jgi:hypothetical protein